MRSMWLLFALLLPLVLATEADAARRVALVIGNDRYLELATLRNAKADASSFAELLEEKKFDDVHLHFDLGRQEIDLAIANFVETIEPGDIAVFFFSGHGWSDGSQNYLVGIDAPRNGSERVLARLTIPLQNGTTGVLDEMDRRGASLKVAIIDACRDNPFSPSVDGKSAGLGRGLASVDPGRGTFVVFSAGIGQTALDRLPNSDLDPNSVFTRTLLPLLRADMPLNDAVKVTQERVYELASKAGHQQDPAYYDQVRGSTCLSEKCQRGNDVEASDEALWRLIAGSKSIGVFEEFKKQFPESRYVPEADRSIALLSIEDATKQPVPEIQPDPVNLPEGLDLTGGYLGVGLQTLTPDLRRGFGLSAESTGAFVMAADPNSTAALAGIGSGDLITAINGEPVADSLALSVAMLQKAPGTTIALTIMRGGVEETVQVQVEQMTQTPAEAAVQQEQESARLQDTGPYHAGLSVASSGNGHGLVVQGVAPDSPAFERGLAVGDTIVEVDTRAVSTTQELEAAIDDVRASGRDTALVKADRNGQALFFGLPLVDSE